MDRKLLIAATAATIIAMIGGYMYAEQQREKSSVSISIGDREISVGFDN